MIQQPKFDLDLENNYIIELNTNSTIYKYNSYQTINIPWSSRTSSKLQIYKSSFIKK